MDKWSKSRSMQQSSVSIRAEDVFLTLADKHSVSILNAAHTGLPSSSRGVGDLSKKQFYVRLKQLVDMGLIEKMAGSVYKLTTFGSLVYNNHLKTMDMVIPAYWQIKGIDALRNRNDFPLEQKENVAEKFFSTTTLHNHFSPTQLASFSVVRSFDHLIPEVLKVLNNAEREVYFATKYHDPHISNLVFGKFGNGVAIHILDGNPEQISLEKRLAAIIRTPPNRETAKLIKKIVHSRRFELKRLADLPISFMVVDGIQLIYETVNFTSPEQFNVAISKYDDSYLAQQFIEYFKALSKNASTANLLQYISTH
jgi:hypothetical protein